MKHKIIAGIVSVIVTATLVWAAANRHERGIIWHFLSGVQIEGGTLDVESGATFALAGTAVTSTAAELNALDGITATVAELNYNDVTTLGTAQASKTVTTDSNIDSTGMRNLTATGTITAGVGFDCTGAADCDFGSADITDMTFLTDGGTVTVDGTISAPGIISSDAGFDCNGAVDCDFGSADITDITLTTDEGTVTVDGDVTLPAEPTGGDAGARHEFIGLPRIKLVALGDFVDGSTANVFLLMDDSPIGECAPIGANTEAADAVSYRAGAGSYKLTFQATVGAAEGIDCTVTGQTTTAFTSVGFWLKSSVAFASGDLEVVLDDGGVAEATENIGAYTTPNVWQWFEVDVTGDCAATCSDIDGVFIQTTAQAPTTFNAAVINLDFGAVWKAAAEKALGVAIVQDGVLGVMEQLIAAASVNTWAAQAEYTDYFVNYQTGNDVIVTITDKSTFTGFTMVAY